QTCAFRSEPIYFAVHINLGGETTYIIGPGGDADPICPEGTVWVDANEDGILDEGECETPEDPTCPEGTEWVDANEDGILDEGECETPEDPTCPEGTEWVDANEDGILDEGECETPEGPEPTIEVTVLTPVCDGDVPYLIYQ